MNSAFMIFGDNLIGRKILTNLVKNNLAPKKVVQEVSQRTLFTQVFEKLYCQNDPVWLLQNQQQQKQEQQIFNQNQGIIVSQDQQNEPSKNNNFQQKYSFSNLQSSDTMSIGLQSQTQQQLEYYYHLKEIIQAQPNLQKIKNIKEKLQQVKKNILPQQSLQLLELQQLNQNLQQQQNQQQQQQKQQQQKQHQHFPFSVKEICEQHNIELLVQKTMNSKKSIQFLEDADLIVLGGVPVLKEIIFKRPKYGCVNTHSGILPDMRGTCAFIWSIYYDIPLGCTSHYVIKEIDQGALINIEYLDVKRGDTLENLFWKQSDLCAVSAVNAVKKLLNKEQKFESLPNDLNRGRYCSIPGPEIVERARQILENQEYSHYSSEK